MNMMPNTMKPSINNRLLDTLMWLIPAADLSCLQWFGRVRSHTRKKPSRRTRITLAWADNRQRHRIIDLATKAGLHTLSLKNSPKAKIVVLRCADGRIAGWAGMDVETDPEHPEVFSGFVCPEFRGHGLGSLLEHVWWAYISAWGCKTAYMRLDCAVSQHVVNAWRKTGYCYPATDSWRSRQLTGACPICELFALECEGSTHLAVDIEKALAVSIQRMGHLDICRLPIRFSIETTQVSPTADLSATFELSTQPQAVRD